MFNYCPKCNSKNIEFKQQHYIVCSDCNFIYYHNVASAVAAIIVFQKKILFVTRAQQPGLGLLDLPGGFVDPDESLEQALSREIKEELGVNVTSWKYICSQPNIYLSNNIEYRTLDSIFLLELNTPMTFELQKSEISSICWILPADVNFNKLAFSSVKATLKYYLNNKKVK